jgi:protoporphyrinogen oxidase
MAERCCIVGGGMLGLSLARKFAMQGMHVELLEGSGEAGGLASPWRIGDVVWDRFYHVITSSDTVLLELLNALGLECEVRWSSAQTGFYTDQRLYPFSTPLDFLRFPPLNLVDKFRLGTTILRAAKYDDPLALERITAVEWLTELSGPKVVERIWLPLLRAKLGVNAERVSAAFIWAIIVRMYGARQGRSKRELFGYVPGGYRRILNRLCEDLYELGVVLRVDTPVADVSPAGNGRVRVTSSRGAVDYDRVVVTLPAPNAAAVCSGLLPFERNRLLDVEYQGVLCASVLLKRPLSPYYITNITDRMPFTAIIEMDALVDPAFFNGYALVYLPRYMPSGDPAFDRDDESIRNEFIAALNRTHPDFGMNDVAAFRVARARYVLPISTLGYSDRIPPIATTVPNLYVVNSTQIVNGTLNVNQTLMLANQAFDEIERAHPHPASEASAQPA